MKAFLVLSGCLCFNLLMAQPGYQYNGATGRYEYNTDPLGGMAQRFQDYTNMQTATMQRLNNNLNALQQTAPAGSPGNDLSGITAEINLAVARGKNKIATGKAANTFNWVYSKNVTAQQKKNAEAIKAVITHHGLNVNNYADVKAFFAVTFYLVATQSSDEGRSGKKGEAKKLNAQYLKNDYVQGMTDEQKTNNHLSDLELLAQIGIAGPSGEKAKQIAAQSLLNRGYAEPLSLLLTNEGLLNKGKQAIAGGKAKSNFIRSKESLYIKNLLAENKITQQQSLQYQKYLDAFDALVKKIGGPDNDHAFGQSLMFAIYYTIHNDGASLSKKQLDAIIKLFYQDITADEKMQAADDNTLQQFYERLAIECMANSDLYAVTKEKVGEFEKKQNNPEIDTMEKLSAAMNSRVHDDMKSVKEAAHIKLREFFQPRSYDEYKLTEEGFIKK